MRITTTIEMTVTAETPSPSKEFIRTTPLMQRCTDRTRETYNLLKKLERDGKFEKEGRYSLTFADELSYGLSYFGNN